MDVLTQFYSQESLLRDLTVLAGILVAGWLVFLVVRRVLVALVRQVSRRTTFAWDDIVVEAGVFGSLALVAPAVVLALGAGILESWGALLSNAANLLLLLAAVGVADRLLTAVLRIYQLRPDSARRPIKGPVQLVKIFVYLMSAVAAIAFVLGKSPWGLLSGIGAFTAVLLLVFRDTILSFVAGMQIVTGDLVRQGDWLEVPAFGADGDVLDIALYTVRVQNFDKTIVAIPTYKLMDTGFKNWRGMSQSGGRRIKRSLIIDQATVTFADEKFLASLKKVQGVASHIEAKEQEIAAFNAEHGVDPSHPLNGRRLTNLGCFRAYVKHYLEHHPMIRQDMTLIVRQLTPSKEGLPLELYCFTSTTDWAEYEAIQSDIFDHVLAALPWFRLKTYQRNLGPDTRIPDEIN